MHLAPGVRLGPYEIVAPLGAGGMGDVYRARDPRLGRDVAIKVLGTRFQQHDEYRTRFEREARAVAGLNHPNIGALHDVGREGDTDYLVMELVEGETLASRLSKGPLSVQAACRLGAQIAAGLAAAHARGIVHRDLKPSNVMVTAAGAKLLDFGLARRFEQGPVDRSAVEFAGDLTGAGTIIGTLSYMAPEQIEGGSVDARTDIFALGALLYEMLTGRRPFSGPSDAALIAAVLTTEPASIGSLRSSIPRSLDRLIRECMKKDPTARWQSAHDVELMLLAIAGETDADPMPGTARRRSIAPWIAGTAATVAILLWTYYVTIRPERAAVANPSSVQFTIEPPEGGTFNYSTETGFLAVSPDGGQVAFVAAGRGSGSRIWLRAVGSIRTTPIPGTEGAMGIAWSPDGQSIAFFVAGRLQRIDLRGGAPVTICEVENRAGTSISWGTTGQILFAGIQGEVIYRVSEDGGIPEPVVVADTAGGVFRVQFPMYLPDGEHFLYLARHAQDEAFVMRAGGSGAPDTIVRAESLVQYAEPGVLAFVRDGSLLGQAFDWKTARVSGPPFGVFDGVRYFLSTGVAAFASAGGTLAVQTGNDLQRLAWFDRAGNETASVGPQAGFLTLQISRDGKQLLFDRQDPRIGTWDVWILDLERDVAGPITAGRGTEAYGNWLPGDGAVIYSVSRDAPPSLMRRDMNTGVETPLLPRGVHHIPTDVSADGRTLLFSQRVPGGSFDIWSLALYGGDGPQPLVRTPGDDTDARFSPDGRYAALLSEETGTKQLYVTPFPGRGTRTRVSSDGASMFRWSHATGELIYVTPDRRVVSVNVRTDPLQIGPPTTLFTLPAGMAWKNFDLSPDGARILAAVSVAVANEQPVTIMTNWTTGRK